MLTDVGSSGLSITSAIADKIKSVTGRGSSARNPWCRGVSTGRRDHGCRLEDSARPMGRGDISLPIVDAVPGVQIPQSQFGGPGEFERAAGSAPRVVPGD